jgi:hypothetical protein
LEIVEARQSAVYILDLEGYFSHIAMLILFRTALTRDGSYVILLMGCHVSLRGSTVNIVV